MAQPEHESANATRNKGSQQEERYWSPRNQSHQKYSNDDDQPNRMASHLTGSIGTKGNKYSAAGLRIVRNCALTIDVP